MRKSMRWMAGVVVLRFAGRKRRAGRSGPPAPPAEFGTEGARGGYRGCEHALRLGSKALGMAARSGRFLPPRTREAQGRAARADRGTDYRADVSGTWRPTSKRYRAFNPVRRVFLFLEKTHAGDYSGFAWAEGTFRVSPANWKSAAHIIQD